MESGVQPSLHPNCDHQFLFAKFDLSNYDPPPYEKTVRYHNRATADLIRRKIDLFDCDEALCINDVDKQVDQRYKSSFHEKHKSIQYNAALIVTGAIRGSSSEKLYQEFGLESLQGRRWSESFANSIKF